MLQRFLGIAFFPGFEPGEHRIHEVVGKYPKHRGIQPGHEEGGHVEYVHACVQPVLQPLLACLGVGIRGRYRDRSGIRLDPALVVSVKHLPDRKGQARSIEVQLRFVLGFACGGVVLEQGIFELAAELDLVVLVSEADQVLAKRGLHQALTHE
ncbi:hypothetical protein D3C79_496100 [compost metagenome]